MAAAKSKHVSFPNQREQCRLNKFTYTEKCGCGIVTLMCNYPFADPKHKKGVCRASTCTDMRKTLAEDIDEISGEETFDEGAEKVTEAMGADKEAGSMAEEPVESEAPRTGGSIDDTDGTDSKEAATEEGDPKGAVRAE